MNVGGVSGKYRKGVNFTTEDYEAFILECTGLEFKFIFTEGG